MSCLKLRLWKLTTILLLFLSSVAHAEFQFLTYEQFLSLTQSEQKQYVIEVKKLTLELTQDSPVSLWQRIFFQSSYAQSSSRAEFNQVASDTNEELNRLHRLMRANRMYKQASKDHKAPATIQVLAENNAAFVQRMNNLKGKLTNLDQVRAFNEVRNDYAKDFPTFASQIQAGQLSGKNVPTSNPSPKLQPTAAQPPAKAYSAPDDGKGTNSVAKKPAATQTQSPAPVATAPAVADASDKKCIYAGFVIAGGSCQPYKKIPKEYEIEEIKPDFFKCENDEDIICNPLLFGYKQTCFKVETKELCHNKPICIKRSVNATKNCTQLTDTTDDLKQILSLWKNPKNKKTYEKFMNDLNELCSADSIASNDVYKTCGVAAKRFNQVMAEQFPGRAQLNVKPRANPTTESGRSQK